MKQKQKVNALFNEYIELDKRKKEIEKELKSLKPDIVGLFGNEDIGYFKTEKDFRIQADNGIISMVVPDKLVEDVEQLKTLWNQGKVFRRYLEASVKLSKDGKSLLDKPDNELTNVQRQAKSKIEKAVEKTHGTIRVSVK